jgi:ABC-2 type transport system permease protein
MDAFLAYIEATLTIAELEIRKIRHDPTEVFTRAVQPTLWLLVFGEVMNRARVIQTGGVPYIDFLTPGVLAQSVLFVAIFYGIAVIWERDLGIVHKFLASPAPRSALVLGKAVSAGARAMTQVVIVYIIALAVGVHVSRSPLALAGVVVAVLLGAAVFSTFSLIIACLVRTRERFMGIGQVLTMPLFFASNAIYPIALMPRWLQVVSHVNPLTYEVDALRSLLLPGVVSGFPLPLDFGLLLLSVVVMVVVGGRLYPRVAY